MKKGFIGLIILFIIGINMSVKEVQSDTGIKTIPDEAIRLRILANSDAEKDQEIKRAVRDEVNNYIAELVQYIDNIEEARDTIAENVPKIKEIVAATLLENDVTDSFAVEYRSNVTFPLKVYDNFVYPAGEYEAVLITIGAGKGSNWWCVLFPPLCFLDFSNGTTVEEINEAEDESIDELAEESDDTKDNEKEKDMKVTFFLFEWLGWS